MLEKALEHNKSHLGSASATKKSSIKIYLFILAILALVATNVYFYIQYKKSSSNVFSMLSEKSQLEAELDRIELELDRVKVENQLLSDQLLEEQQHARNLIGELRIRLTQNELSQGEMESAKKQIESLRQKVDVYKKDVEFLHRENALLVHANDSLVGKVVKANVDLEALREKNELLESQAKAAAVLKLSSIDIHGISFKRNGQEKLESSAKKTDELRINFTITENPFAPLGAQEIYLRIIDPNGNLVLPEEDIKSTGSSEMQYSAKLAIDFNNDGKEYVFNWKNPGAFRKGTYTVVFYQDNQSMGRANVALN